MHVHDIDRLKDSMNSEVLPTNPRPFALTLADGVRNHGTHWIRSDDAKCLLWVLLASAYGETETVDIEKEWCRLTESDDND